jgi:tetratricopeptide (TPR) repeat protein
VSGRSWTAAQELVCRCAFKAVVTTNYDPGVVDARMRVRPTASATGFTTWDDELGLDRWRTGDVFGEAELPVLFAHGQHNRPDTIVLATAEYRRAYAGKLPSVLGTLVDGGHLAWIGFSFADQRIAAILREIADRSGARIDPGTEPRHVAVMPWDPAGGGYDPGVLAQRAEIGYGAHVVMYPAPDGDHAALAILLSALADPRFPPAPDLPTRPVALPTHPIVLPARADGLPERVDVALAGPRRGADAAGPESGIPERWVPAAERVEVFTGRAEELARLDRWAADPQVALVGVTALGGAGKTALVTRWVQEAVGWSRHQGVRGVSGWSRRPGVRGVFGWSFYADPSAEHWAAGLLDWASEEFGVQVAGSGRRAAAVLAVLRAVSLLLVLDGLEVVQEGPADDGFGRLLDGTLREVLAGACQQPHRSLVVLTSRFPFADLEPFDGGSARMLDVPPLTPAAGSELLAAAGADWLGGTEREALVAAVDGHALAVAVLAGLLADRPPASDLAVLRAELAEQTRTSARVRRVLEFYSARLSEPDRYLLAAISLFARPVPARAALAVAGHDAFGGRLAGWTPAMAQDAVRDRLGGLATWHPDGRISAHPLVHATFQPLVMDAATAAAETALTGIPEGVVTSQADAQRVVEAIELLIDADQWDAADSMYKARAGSSSSSSSSNVWKNLPAARLGQRAATAFAGRPARRDACTASLGPPRMNFYVNEVGLLAMYAGDLARAREQLTIAAQHYRDARYMIGLSVSLRNLAECLGYLGEISAAQAAAAQALGTAKSGHDWSPVSNSHVFLGWLAALSGDAVEAEEQFIAADQITVTNDPDGDHLYSFYGSDWAEWLARTGRPGPARALTSRNLEICRTSGWNADAAVCERILGRLALATGDTAAAGAHLTATADCFRDGDCLTDLASTLADLAEQARATGNFDTAERYAAEAITIAGPRQIVGAHSAALAARARNHACQATPGAKADHLAQGRDAADAALRLAARHHLAWNELAALRAHADLDHAEGIDHGWAAKADALQARLIPPGLDPDPLATVERLVAAKKPAKTTGRRARRR